ncbi:MAG: spore gernimation protein, partial [Paenibacillus sp.]|nr:spore gernimation protein [Paenibacillus sp.]
MSKTEVVNAWQMALLYLAYASGSAIINLPGPLTGFSKNGAWLSLLIAGGASLLLLLCLLYMH